MLKIAIKLLSLQDVRKPKCVRQGIVTKIDKANLDMTLEEHFKAKEPFTMLQIQFAKKSTSSKYLYRYNDEKVLYENTWIDIKEAIQRQNVLFGYANMLNVKLVSRVPDENHQKGYSWETFKEIQ